MSEVEEKVDGTRHLYTEEYFQGDRERSNYSGYVEASLGPTTMLAETLFRVFRPLESLDVGCAVGHGVKRLTSLGVDAHGLDISDWAVRYADTPRVRQGDFSQELIRRQFDLVYSYDVVEHVMPERLAFAINNLWQATRRDLLIVPATYENGETFDPDEPTHLILEPFSWWVDFVVRHTGARFDEEASQRYAQEEHSTLFGYAHRIMIFTRLGA